MGVFGFERFLAPRRRWKKLRTEARPALLGSLSWPPDEAPDHKRLRIDRRSTLRVQCHLAFSQNSQKSLTSGNWIPQARHRGPETLDASTRPS